jgi:hypothetical protein
MFYLIFRRDFLGWDLGIRRELACGKRLPDSALKKGVLRKAGATADAIQYIDTARIAEVKDLSRTGRESRWPGADGPRGSGRAAFLEGYALDAWLSVGVHRDGVLEAVEDFIRGVLQTGVGLVKLAGRLGGKLAELVAVGNVGESSKNKI